MEKVLLAWSGGKDCALSLYELQKSGEYKIAGLLTTITAKYDRISMHGVRRKLLLEQASNINLPLEEIFLPQNSSIDVYEAAMRSVLEKKEVEGVKSVVFGDVFLDDVREYREEKLRQVGFKGIFPLWKRDTAELARIFIESGFKAIVTCVDTEHLDGAFVGKEYDRDFLDELPEDVDPCGENGEFHTFVYDGPVFNSIIKVSRGQVVLRDERFYFCDLIPYGLK